MASGLDRSLTAYTQDRAMIDFHSSSVDFFTITWTGVLASGETISASGVSAFAEWYLPAGFTAFNSGTGTGAMSFWMKLSATGAPGTQGRASARILTTSARRLYEAWDMRIFSGD